MKVNGRDLDIINKIIAKLEDEESKRIYMYRLLYSLTGDIRYIYDMMGDLARKNKKYIVEKNRWVQKTYQIYKRVDLYTFLLMNYEKSDKNIIIFGAGKVGKEVLYWLNSIGYQAEAFCDNDLKKIGSSVEGHLVISVEKLKRDFQNSIIIIAVLQGHAEIKRQLASLNISLHYIYEYEANSLMSSWGTPYFDPDIFEFSEKEIFVDAGAFHGETTIEFTKRCPLYEKVYSFEPDRINFSKLISDMQNNITDVEWINAGLWNENRTLYFERGGDNGTGACIKHDGKERVSVVSLDHVLNGAKVTYIKMDIEGAELEALEGAKETIKKYKPKLAICVYHKYQDILAIPEYILELLPEYKLKLRHYTTYLYDTILYAYI